MAKKSKQRLRMSEFLHQRYYRGKSNRRVAEAHCAMAALALGDKIRTLREDAGMTQAQLAKEIGTQPSQISRIEDADYTGHSVETLRRIAEALNATLKIELVAGSERRKPLRKAG